MNWKFVYSGWQRRTWKAREYEHAKDLFEENFPATCTAKEVEEYLKKLLQPRLFAEEEEEYLNKLFPFTDFASFGRRKGGRIT